MPSGNKPLPGPMLTQIYVAIWRHQVTMSWADTYVYDACGQLQTTSNLQKLHKIFRYWLVTYSVTSQYLNQCSLILNWSLRNTFQWNFITNANNFIIKGIWNCHLRNVGRFVQASVTLNVWGLNYSFLTMSISWLLMHWLLVSPGHQYPW